MADVAKILMFNNPDDPTLSLVIEKQIRKNYTNTNLMSIKVYGIKNCNTMKKTFDFLAEKEVEYEFIDYKKQNPDAPLLEGFLKKTDLASLVNKKGMTYRKMTDEQKSALENEETAIPILEENSSMIKRPVIVYKDGSLSLGFDPEVIESHLA